MGSEQHYSLRWNDYTLKIVTAFQSLRDEEDFVDVTVACDGHHYSAHKMVLSACSPYFRSLLRANPCQHPIVILKDVGHSEMERLLEFMYNGEVNIAQDQLAAFLKTAECLKIRGLAGSSDDIEHFHTASMNSREASFSQVLGSAGVTTVIGGTSGGNSPSGYSVNQDLHKDEDITVEAMGPQSDSPSHKRLKRIHAHLPDMNTSQGSGENSQGEIGDRTNCSGNDTTCTNGSGLGMDDDLRCDGRSELKHEPNDPMNDVYSETSEISGDPTHTGDTLDHRQNVMYPIAMAGPSGSSLSGQDNLSPNETGAPGGAVCEALNLSLRAQVNGSSMSGPISPLRHHLQPVQHQVHHQLNTHLCVATSTHNNANYIACGEEHFAVKIEPMMLDSPAPHIKVSETGSYSDVVMDLTPPCDKLKIGPNQELSVNLNVSTHSLGGSSDFKVKSYPCPECPKIFRHPMSLHHHRHVHKGTYTCQSCGKVFSRRWDLHRHIHRSKMGCRRPNHTVASSEVLGIPSSQHLRLTTVQHQRSDLLYDLNNPPSN